MTLCIEKRIALEMMNYFNCDILQGSSYLKQAHIVLMKLLNSSTA